MSPADFLTLTRLVLVPVLLWAFWTGQYFLALLLFMIAGGTDLVDGTVARLLKRQTRVGAVLDPIADKALMAATFVCLWSIQIVPWWFLLLVLGRDILIVGGLVYLKCRRIQAELKPFWTSKLATLFQLATAIFGFMGFLQPDWIVLGKGWNTWMQFPLWSATILIGVSGVQYLLKGVRILQHAKTTN